MSFIVVTLLLIGLVTADDCAELCRRDSRCVRGSWCKGDSVRGSCHNFFYDSADKTGSFHYHGHGMNSVYPVLCGEARGLISRIESSGSTPTSTVPTSGRVVSAVASSAAPTLVTSIAQTTIRPFSGMTCSTLCESVSACRLAGRGSYCKPNGTCSALFLRTRGGNDVCYHQSGSDCPDDYPVTCNPASSLITIVAQTRAEPTLSAVTTSPLPITRSATDRIESSERPATGSLHSHVNGRSFRSISGELGVTIVFESRVLRLDFTYRGSSTSVEGLEYVIEGNFVHLQRGGPLRHLIDSVESIGSAITHHRHSAHHVTIHIVPAGTVQNDSTYVIVRLGDLAPTTCTAF